MLIVGFGILVWIVHAARLCLGLRATWWMALPLVNLSVRRRRALAG